MAGLPTGAALREVREAAGLTVAEAATELGVDRTTLYRKIKELRLDLSRVDF